MAKKILINNCRSCPYHYVPAQPLPSNYVRCQHDEFDSGKNIVQWGNVDANMNIDIPDWCPLEDN